MKTRLSKFVKNLTSINTFPARNLYKFAIACIGMLASGTIFGQTTVTEIITSGTTWTVPCGVSTVDIEIYGAGGGGGGSNTGGDTGGGGGSGGYSFLDNLSVTPNTTISFTLGTGGTGGCSGANGTNGTPTTLTYGATNVTANGGSFGEGDDASGDPAAGGAGGTATGGTTNTTGGSGQTGTDPNIGGAGGAAPGPNGGGASPGGAAGINGSDGLIYGGGGAGSGDKDGGSNPCGGDGAAGAIVITYTTTVTIPSAGADQEVCSGNMPAIVAANLPDAGWTAIWSVTSGSATISNVNDPNTSISAISPGSCATLQWTFSTAGCPDFTDDLEICVPVTCNDNPCNATPISVGTSCSMTSLNLGGATVTTGIYEPACNGMSTDNAPDLWYSVTVPSTGTVTVETLETPGGPSADPGIAIYEGSSCSDLYHAGCDYTLSSTTPAVLQYTGTPGETIWIRVWDYYEGTNEDIDLCVYTHSNTTADIVTGNTTITCGGGPYSFSDPAGSGNYENESTATYTICPDTPGEYVSVNFSEFDLETNFDYLTVMDGGGTFDSIIGNYTGSTLPPTITSSNTDGCLTFTFRTDNIGVGTGWLGAVSCTSTPGVNTPICTSTNCSGDCGQWICGDGLYPTENQGTSSVEEITYQSGGCWQGAGEISTKWFYFTILNSGTIEITFDGPSGQDYDFAVWGPSTNGEPACPVNTGDAPIRCSYSGAQNPVGIGNGADDLFEDISGDGWVQELQTIAGETYVLALNIFQNGNPQPTIDITFGGTGNLDCSVLLLPVSFMDFYGMSMGDRNLLTWFTASEFDNDYFTLERSSNAKDWEIVGTKDGAGQSQSTIMYEMYDSDPYPITYYRVKQTDYNEEFDYSDIIVINRDRVLEGDLVSMMFPNSADEFTSFTYNGNELKTPMNVQIVNQVGMVVANYTYKNLSNTMATTIRTSDLSEGVYQVVFTQGENKMTQKLSIVR